MSFHIDKNISEIKNEYTQFLLDITTNLIYEGLESIYNDSIDADLELQEKSKNNPAIESYGILKLFQMALKEIPKYNKDLIETETNRIKMASKCGDFYDDLIKAIVKSNIMLLTMSQNELLDDKYYETIETTDFIHKCYIECAKSIYNNAELFWHKNLSSLEKKNNQKHILELVRKSIKSAIRKLLPMKNVLHEFLNNERKPDMDERINNMRNLVGGDNSYKNGYEEIVVDNNIPTLNNEQDNYMNTINDKLKDLKEAIDNESVKSKKSHRSTEKTRTKSESSKITKEELLEQNPNYVFDLNTKYNNKNQENYKEKINSVKNDSTQNNDNNDNFSVKRKDIINGWLEN